MNGAMVVMVIAILAGLLFAFVSLFLFSCKLAGLPRPRFITAAGVVIATTFVWFLVEALFLAGLRKLYAFAGFPPWEVWVVGIFAGLPVSLAAATMLHVAMLRVTVSQAIHVWFIERLIRFSFVLAGLGIVALAMAAK